jgi:hypothetical protein
MTRLTTHPAGDSLPPDVQVTFRDDVTQPERRQAAERSVATLVARAAEAAARARDAETRRAALTAALSAPLMKLIEADPAARKARDELGTERAIAFQPSSWVLAESPSFATALDPAIVLHGLQGGIEVRVPPYDFTWSWFNQQGSRPFNQMLINATGRVGLQARSGAVPGGASGFVEAHAGFGLLLNTDHPVTVTGRSLRRMQHSYEVRAVGVGGNATSEGGMEFTALEDGTLVASASHKLWRERVSASLGDLDESGSGAGGPFAVTEPSELVFTMTPGREYTFNVGIWVFSDRSTGVGAAAADSLLQGNVLALTIQRE